MNVSGSLGRKMFFRAVRNAMQNRPLSVSFEITHACTANCWHCNWGGPIEEKRLGAEDYARICRELRPVVAHVSGGEPLARGDVYEIVDRMTTEGGLPWMVVVTNAANLTVDRFSRLKEAGMHQLSVSLDFPDERHDEFRRVPGLYETISEVVPEIARRSDADDVVLNACITSWNYLDLPAFAKRAKEWGVPINFSVYTHLRVDDRDGLVSGAADLAALKSGIERVIELRKQGYPVYTSPRVMWKYYSFLAEGGVGGCRAGSRFLVINPDGRLTPCAMVMAYFDDQQRMVREFSKQNACEACYISTRANTEKTLMEFVQDNRQIFGRMLTPWRN